MRPAPSAPPPPSGEKPAPPGEAGRLRFLDLLRALASQLIVLHHLAFYGPLSDVAYPLLPAVIDLLSEHARMAVQVFFVLGGFVTARGLERLPATWRGLGKQIARRYLRIGVPYLATLALAVVANAIARRLMTHDSISAPPSLGQLLAHAAFLHDLLGYEALTAGIWYLAVDFQLFLLTLLAFAGAGWLSRRLGRGDGFLLAQAALWPLALASLFHFNRDPGFDRWAIYFFGSFFLGMVLAWALSGRLPKSAFWALLAAVVGAAAFDWRPRLAVAAGTALLVWLASAAGLLARWPASRPVAHLGRLSYSLFLVHFPVCLVVNAALIGFVQGSPLAASLGMLLAWALSLGAAEAFHRLVEAPCSRARAPAARAEGGAALSS